MRTIKREISAAKASLEATNQARLQTAKRTMLERYKKDVDLCSFKESVPESANLKLLREWQAANRIFGVHFEGFWHFPAFQLNEAGRPIPEVSQVLAALKPSASKWDYLQWFLELNPHLGETPLAVWEGGYIQRVLDAAAKERWSARE